MLSFWNAILLPVGQDLVGVILILAPVSGNVEDGDHGLLLEVAQYPADVATGEEEDNA